MCLVIELPGAVIIFMALSIDDEMGFAAQAIAASRGGEDFSAAYRAERCVPG